MKILGNSNSARTRPMAVAMSEFNGFLLSDLGKEVLALEQNILDQQLPQLAACRLLQLSVQKAKPLVQAAAVGQYVTMGYAPGVDEGSDHCWADYQSFPVASDCIDIVMLHHVLEFADEPQQLLREADRTLTAGGHILIMGFNPLSSWSIYRYYHRLSQGKPLGRQALRLGRLCDWLSVLNYDVLNSQHYFCRPAINHASVIKSFAMVDKLAQKLAFPHGLFYFILARKRSYPIDPIGPVWRQRVRRRAPVAAHSCTDTRDRIGL